MTPAPLGWHYTKADIFFLYKVQLYLTHFLFCFCGPDTLTGDKLNVEGLKLGKGSRDFASTTARK